MVAYTTCSEWCVFLCILSFAQSAGFGRASKRNLEWQLQQQLTRSTTRESRSAYGHETEGFPEPRAEGVRREADELAIDSPHGLQIVQGLFRHWGAIIHLLIIVSATMR
jgi:hypothetical protein